MTSKIDVVNQALNELGRPNVIEFTDTQDATILWYALDSLLPECLLITDWNFAIKFVIDNTPLVTSFSPDFPYSYQLPPDYNRMDRISWQTVNFGLYYRIIDGLLCANSRPMQYYYVVNDVDYGIIPPLFYRMLILYLASKRCMVITNNGQLEAYLTNEYKQKKIDAIRQNDMDRFISSTPYNDFYRQVFI